MTRTRFAALAAALAAIGGGTAAATQSAAAATAHPASGAALTVANVKVAVGTTNKAHKLLVNAKGLPVYLLTGDSSSHPLCKGNCLTYWPAVTTTLSHPKLGAGIKGKIGVWKHNKINQVTLNGHPLYTYAQDSKGAALGEGLKSFGGVWEVMQPSGSPMAKSKSSSSSGGGGW